MVRKKTIKAWQVVRYVEPHKGWKFYAVCHGHLEDVYLLQTCLRGTWYQNWHRINSLMSLLNYSVNSINHFYVWIIFLVKTQKKQVWKNNMTLYLSTKEKTSCLVNDRKHNRNCIAFMAFISNFATHICMRWKVLTSSNI